MSNNWIRFGEQPTVEFSAETPVQSMHMSYRSPAGLETPVYRYTDADGYYTPLVADLVYWQTTVDGTFLVVNTKRVMRLYAGALYVRAVIASLTISGEGVIFYLQSGRYAIPVGFINMQSEFYVAGLQVGPPPADPQPGAFRMIGSDWDDVVCNLGASGLLVNAIGQEKWTAGTETGDMITFDNNQPWEYS